MFLTVFIFFLVFRSFWIDLLFFQVKMVAVYVIHSRMIMDNEDHISDKIGSTFKSRSVSGFSRGFWKCFLGSKGCG